MGETDKSKPCVWRWQERFMHEGVGGLLRDKSRPPGKAPIAPDRVAWIVRQTQQPPPHEATHWTLRAMAKAAGVAASTVQAIWKAHGLSPHRWRNFKLSNDPAFAEKLADIVGLYVDPPAHAVVLSIDEKSQIQALDRRRLTVSSPCRTAMTISSAWGAMARSDNEKVAVENSGVAHGFALRADEKGRGRAADQMQIEIELALDMVVGGAWKTGGYPGAGVDSAGCSARRSWRDSVRHGRGRACDKSR